MAEPLHRDTMRRAGFPGRGWKDHQKTPSWWLAESLAQLKTANTLVSGDSAGRECANTHPKKGKKTLSVHQRSTGKKISSFL